MRRTRMPWPRLLTTRGPRANALRHGFLQLEDRSTPTVIAWDGGPTGNGNDWTDPVNWAGDTLPGANDDVVLSPSGSNPIILLRSDAAVRSVENVRSLLILGNGADGDVSLAVTDGFANDGFLAMISEGGNWKVSVALAGGNLTNGAFATISTLYGTGGARSVNFSSGSGRLINLGTLSVDADFAVNGPAGAGLETSGEVAIAPGRTLRPGRAFTYLAGSIGGGGTLDLTGTTAKLVPDLVASENPDLVLRNTTVNGPGTLAVAAWATLTSHGAAINAPFANYGTFVVRGDTTLGGPFTTGTGSTVRAIGNDEGGHVSLTANDGFTNNGLIELANEGEFVPSLVMAGGPLTNANGATLTGAGTVAGLVNGPGTVSAGCPQGILTVNGNVGLSGPFVVELTGVAPGTGYDQVAVNGTVTLNGAALQVSRNFASEPWDEFVILSNDSNEQIVGTFDGLPEGAALAIDGWAFRITYLGGSFHNDIVLTQFPRAKVTGVVVNDFQPNLVQRSRVTSVAVTFDQVVTFVNPGNVAAAFELSRVGGGAIGVFTATTTIQNGVTVVRLANFGSEEAEFGSLADGRYHLRVRANQVIGLDGNDDGAAGDDYTLAGTVANGLYRLFGDGNGDGLVNALDFVEFRRAFGTSMGQGAYVDWLDFDAGGAINAVDFARFRNRFGSSVP